MTGALTFLREFKSSAEVEEIDSPQSNEEAYRAGVAAGLSQARAEAATEMQDAVNEMIALLNLGQQSRDEIYAAAHDESGLAVATVIRTLCPHLAELGLAETARKLMKGSLQSVPRPIVIHAAQAVADTIRDAINTEVSEDVEVHEQEALAPSHIQIAWTGGSAEVDYETITSQIFELAAELSPTNSQFKESEVQ